MSKEISSTIDDAKLETDAEINPNNELDHKKDESSTSPTLGTETVDKTPISSAATFNELHKNENEDLAVLANESFETTEPTEGFNETECVKFAEKLYKVLCFLTVVLYYKVMGRSLKYNLYKISV
jgi:hypothetical protein